MTGVATEAGWWLASDGRWYPPAPDDARGIAVPADTLSAPERITAAAPPASPASDTGSRLLLAAAALAASLGVAAFVASVIVATAPDTTTSPEPMTTPVVSPVPVSVTCGGPFGWMAQPEWPGDVDGIAAYRITATANGLQLLDALWSSAADVGEPLVGLEPGIVVAVIADAQDDLGRTLATTVTKMEVPLDSC